MNFETAADVDFGRYLLNFDGLLLQMDLTGSRAHVYFQQACRHLDAATGFCLVHRTPEQPSICVHYNEYKCSYKQHMLSEVDPDTPLVDRNRMAWYAAQIEVDDAGRISTFPDPDRMLEAFASMPLERQAINPPPTPTKRVVARLDDSCSGCHAWCCKTLVFERPPPRLAQEIDLFRYYLGFPSLEIGVSDSSWSIVVHTTCRHLTPENICAAFGRADRPRLCSEIDAVGCGYKVRFGTERPEGYVRIGRDDYPALMASIRFDEAGGIAGLPSVAELRGR